MCRLSAFFGAPICAADLVTRPSRSITTQSFDARERLTEHPSQPGYLNGDGFGLGWYSSNPNDLTPCVYRQARPAWNDPNLSSIAEKVYTPVLFAHVRAASQGMGVTETTCHPFRYGRYLWMHNGMVGNFAKVRRKLLAELDGFAFDFAAENGGSDSALCFAVFLSLIGDVMERGNPDKLRACLRETIMTLERALKRIGANETSLLNFVVSDGESLAASRYVIDLQDKNAKAASLYYASGNSYQPDGSAPGNYAMMHTDRRPSLAIISSEPLTERNDDWVAVPRNSCVVVTKSMHILVAPVASEYDALVSRVVLNLEDKHAKRGEVSCALEKRQSHGEDTNSINVVANGVAITVQSTITIPGRTVLCCAVMESLLCSGTDDGTVHVWNIEDNIRSEVFRIGHRPVLAMLADVQAGALICATSASVVIVYYLTPEGKFKKASDKWCRGAGDILSLAKIGKRIFAGFSDTMVRCIIDDVNKGYDESVSAALESGSEECSLDEASTAYIDVYFPNKPECASHFGHIFALTPCLADRFLCTGGGDGLLRVWDVEKEECIQRRDDHTGAILAMVAYEIEKGTILFSGSRDQSVKVWIWDGDNGFVCKRTLRKHKDEVVFLSLLGDKLVSGSADGTICVWCVETLALVCQYRDNGLKAGSVSLRHNLLFTASDEGAIYIRDFLSAERVLCQRESQEENSIVAKNETRTASSAENNTSDSAKENNVFPSRYQYPNLDNYIVTEVPDIDEKAEILIPGVTNEKVLLSPMLPLVNSEKIRSQQKNVGDPYLSDGYHEVQLKGKVHPLQSFMHSTAIKGGENAQALEKRLLQDILARFVSFPTVSGHEKYREDCWQGARYISTFLEGLGAKVKFVGGISGSNPVVLAKFSAVNPEARTLTFYGHYDVMPVDAQEWSSDPWTLTNVDGYFYGRGATDNKGPIIAMIFAVKKLIEESGKDGLRCNIVLILQGEAEVSNAGFKESIDSHLHMFENTSLILTSNSYWLGEKKPCITYGFRGLIELKVSIAGGSRNLHSGVDGGALFEPMNDLITILGTIVDSGGKVCIPGFYEDVRPLSDSDRELVKGVSFDVKEYQNTTGVKRFTEDQAAELLEARWRKPSVSITSIETSNVTGFYSVVPHRATAKVSIRFVPDQDPSKIEKAIATHLRYEIQKRRSPNELTIERVNKGDWWLGEPLSPHFQIAKRAVRSVWGVDPDYVCEGGSMPQFSYLVKRLGAPLVQVPLGQSSDGAHLPNERIRALNLFRGKEVLQRIITEYAQREL